MAHRADGMNDIFEHDITVRGSSNLSKGTVQNIPAASNDIVNKSYVDTSDNLKVPYTGASSDVDLGTKNLTTTGKVDTQQLYVHGKGSKNQSWVSSAGYLAIGEIPQGAINADGVGWFDPGLNFYGDTYWADTGGNSVLRLLTSSGNWQDTIFQSRRQYTSAFMLKTSAANDINISTVFRGAGLSSTNGDKFGFWNDYPDEWFDVNKTATFRSDVKMMNKLTVGDGSILGNEKLTNGTFTGNANSWTLGTGWTYNTNLVRKDVDGTGTLSQASAAMVTPLVAGETYRLDFTISNTSIYTTGVDVSIGGVSWKGIISDKVHTLYFTALNTNDLVFTPQVTSARFYIDTISLKKVTGGIINSIGGYAVDNAAGVSGSFTTVDSKTVTVTNGIITSIV